MKNAKRPSEPALTSVAVAAQEYVKAGLKVIQWAGDKSKGPREEGWNRPESAISDPKQVLPNSKGIGLAHLYSRTMALDIDNLDLACKYFTKHNIDLMYMLATGIRISSKRPGRAKLIYYIPQDLNAADFLTINDQDNGFELRCANGKGTTVQDVLPPTIHPKTEKPYEWKGPDEQPEPWQRIPLAPMALLEHWYARLNERKSRSAAGPVDPALVPVLQSALTAIDPDCDYATWLAIGMALDAAGQGDLWDEWSQGGSKYQPGDCEARLLGFKPDGGVGVGTLFHHARQAGWEAADCWEELTANLASERPEYDKVLLPRLAALVAYCQPSRGALQIALTTLAKAYKPITKKILEADLSAVQLELRGKALADGDVVDIAANAAARLTQLRKIQCSGDQLWLYDKTHWRKLGDKEAGNLLLEVLTAGGWNIKASLTRMTTEAVTALKYQTVTPTPVVSADPKPIINCQNGEVHILPDGRVELRPHSAESGLLSVLPIGYDADAKAPVFQRVLREAFLPGLLNGQWTPAQLAEAEDMARHLAEVLGYMIVPVRWMPVWFLFYGRGANAKSLLHEILQLLLGRGATLVMPLKELEGPFARNKIFGKTLIVDDDLKANTTLPDDLLKMLSDGKVMSTERKGLDGSFEFQNRAVLLVLANCWPRMIDLTGGMDRRLHVIKFQRRFRTAEELERLPPDERAAAQGDLADIGLKDKLAKELPGILNVLLEGNRRLLTREHKRFLTPAAVSAAREEMQRHANTLVAFTSEVLERCTNKSLPALKVYDSFLNYCANAGIRWELDYNQFRDKLDQLGFVEGDGKTHGKVTLKNVQWKTGLVVLHVDAPSADHS